MKRRPAKTRARKPARATKPIATESPLTPYDPQAAAIDVGATSHWVAVPPESGAESVREFGVFTADLYAIAAWLQQGGVKRVALESTGVYWIPLFEVLEEKGLEVRLVDARKVKNVSGRKSDLLDCQWLRQLHSYGLLAGAFRPANEILPLRAYLRQRQMLVQYAAKHIQHMQKALQQMNVRLDNVVTDITGLTGMRIIKAILAGERDARKLVEDNRHGGCHTSAEVMMQSLVGNYPGGTSVCAPASGGIVRGVSDKDYSVRDGNRAIPEDAGTGDARANAGATCGRRRDEEESGVCL